MDYSSIAAAPTGAEPPLVVERFNKRHRRWSAPLLGLVSCALVVGAALRSSSEASGGGAARANDAAALESQRAAGADAGLHQDDYADDFAKSLKYNDTQVAFDFITNITYKGGSPMVYCPVKSALCNIATCTLNTDKKTASCGCQKMLADESNPAVVSLTEAGILAQSEAYRKLLKYCDATMNCTTASIVQKNVHTQELCEDIDTGNVWPQISGADYISFFSENPLVKRERRARRDVLPSPAGTPVRSPSLTRPSRSVRTRRRLTVRGDQLVERVDDGDVHERRNVRFVPRRAVL